MDKVTETLLRLLQVPKLGAATIGKLCDEITITDLSDYNADQFRCMGWNETQIQRWFQPKYDVVKAAERWLTEQDQRLIHFLQPDYPYLLKQIDSAPPVLFVKGDIAALHHPQIAMVGSRNCSDYGGYWAKYFAAQLSLNGFVVTSGLAMGIDGCSHRAVVEQGGQTVAVLGCGLNIVYPARHKALARNILDNGGALVSEFFPDQPPVAENFPRRNRIISGLSLATLVIEANTKSGSLITARYALEQNREVFALPGNIQNQYSQGCHRLIKQGAMLVENVQDILENLPFGYRSFMSSAAPSTTPRLSSPQTDPRETPLHPDLYAKLSFEPRSADELSSLCGLSIDGLLVQLLDLELQNLIAQKDGLYYRI
ncbi:DNA-processing protein DprA [Pasteurellaceae bacterium LIM206]|nr:DNA-processing protein DprA [Pasteurellaceae bacterium LIM206]